MRRHPGPHRRDRRLRRRPDRLRRDRPAQGEPSRWPATSRRPASRRAATWSSSAPPTPASTRSARRSPSSVFEAGAEGRRRRHHQGQGLRRCHEASRLPRRRRLPRRAPQPPQARLDRRLRHPGPRLQGHADGRPDGRRAPDHPEPDRARHRRRAAACCSSRAPFPAPRAASSWSATAAKARCEGGLSHDHRRRPRRPAGKTAGTVELPAEIFDVQTNIPLIHQVVVAQLAAARQGTHSTKTRGEVRGGGKKPYRQKGTGRARQGSTRAPQFAGGGVVHGPHAARLRPADAQEDEGRRPARCPLRPGPQRPRARRLRRWSRATRRRPRPRSRRSPALSDAQDVLVVLERGDEVDAGRACATWTGCTCSRRTSSTPTTCWSPTTWSSPQGALDAFLGRRRAKGSRGRSKAVAEPRSPRPRERRRAPRSRATERRRDAHKDPRDVLLAPVVSEKSYGLLDEDKYTFLVDPRRQQDRDQDRGRAGLRRQGHVGQHAEPQGQAQAHPVRLRASARTPSARS